MAILGPSGSGKTYSSLQIASGLGDKIALIDTENRSADMYDHVCDFDVAPIDPPFSPDKYVSMVKEADQAGYDVLIIDSLSHAWAGQGGLLEEVDKRKSGQKNQFTAWRDVTPMHNRLVDSILQSKCHVIVTMRVKTAYDFEKDSSGKLKPVKVGLAPVQRDGLEFEFGLVLDIENEKHIATPSKDRTSLFDGQYFVPTKETGETLRRWLEAGEAPPPPQQPAPQATPQPPQQEQPKLAQKNQIQRIQILCKELGINDREERMQRVNKFLQHTSGRTVTSTTDLTQDEAQKLISKLDNMKQQQPQEATV
jgi:hypothetical protein